MISNKQLDNIVREIVPIEIQYPEILAQTWYTLFELNIPQTD